MRIPKLLGVPTWHASTSNPTEDNDGVDTAALGKAFVPGSHWRNTSSGIVFVLDDNATGAADWRPENNQLWAVIAKIKFSSAYTAMQYPSDIAVTGSGAFYGYSADVLSLTSGTAGTSTVEIIPDRFALIKPEHRIVSKARLIDTDSTTNLEIRIKNNRTGDYYEVKVYIGSTNNVTIRKIISYSPSATIATASYTIAANTYYTFDFASTEEGLSLKINNESVVTSSNTDLKEGNATIILNTGAISQVIGDFDFIYMYSLIES